VIGLCLAVAGALTRIDTAEFTLRWEHSIEKVRWEERYRVTGETLHLVEARVAGSGAGMEPPAGGAWRNGVWVYRPDRHLPELLLTRSTFTSGYELCFADGCAPLSRWLGAPRTEGETVRLAPCPA
jgi:hypothetical protein